LRGKDFAFVGDRTECAVPTPVALTPAALWNWVTKKLGMDIATLEQFYAIAKNDHKLCQPAPQVGDKNVTLLHLLVLPPHVLDLCILGQCTPFQFHKYLTMVVTALGAPASIAEIQLMLDWCIMASHHDTHAIFYG
jgi:hypothetical protein